MIRCSTVYGNYRQKAFSGQKSNFRFVSEFEVVRRMSARAHICHKRGMYSLSTLKTVTAVIRKRKRNPSVPFQLQSGRLSTVPTYYSGTFRYLLASVLSCSFTFNHLFLPPSRFIRRSTIRNATDSFGDFRSLPMKTSILVTRSARAVTLMLVGYPVCTS